MEGMGQGGLVGGGISARHAAIAANPNATRTHGPHSTALPKRTRKKSSPRRGPQPKPSDRTERTCNRLRAWAYDENAPAGPPRSRSAPWAPGPLAGGKQRGSASAGNAHGHVTARCPRSPPRVPRLGARRGPPPHTPPWGGVGCCPPLLPPWGSKEDLLRWGGLIPPKPPLPQKQEKDLLRE